MANVREGNVDENRTRATRWLNESAINTGVKDVRFINRRLLFRVKPALGLVPLGSALPVLSPASARLDVVTPA